jgi:hypothetical protein
MCSRKKNVDIMDKIKLTGTFSNVIQIQIMWRNKKKIYSKRKKIHQSLIEKKIATTKKIQRLFKFRIK